MTTRSTKLTGLQAQVLGVVASDGPVVPDDVAYHLRVDSEVARGVLRRLEHRGLVGADYTSHPYSRARAYVITDGGAAALALAFHEEED